MAADRVTVERVERVKRFLKEAARTLELTLPQARRKEVLRELGRSLQEWIGVLEVVLKDEEEGTRPDAELEPEGAVAERLARALDAAMVDLATVDISGELMQVFPEELVHRHKVLPVKRTGDTMYIACCDPSMEILKEELALLRRYRIVPLVAEQSAVEDAIRLVYH